VERKKHRLCNYCIELQVVFADALSVMQALSNM